MILYVSNAFAKRFLCKPSQPLAVVPPKPLLLACVVLRRESLSMIALLFTCFLLRTL